MSFRVVGAVVVAGAVCAAGWGIVGGPAPLAEEAAPDPVMRLHGYGYVPHDAAAFDALAADLAMLPAAELARVAGFADALAADLDRHSPEELAGRIGDLLTVVDLVYADARRVRPAAGGIDPDALRGIAERIGFGATGLTGG